MTIKFGKMEIIDEQLWEKHGKSRIIGMVGRRSQVEWVQGKWVIGKEMKTLLFTTLL